MAKWNHRITRSKEALTRAKRVSIRFLKVVDPVFDMDFSVLTPKRINDIKLTKHVRYAAKYVCPQVFCFDGAVLVLLQFRAFRAEDINDEKCPIDCWTLPIDGSSCSLRYGLYRLLAQGWRRCQAELAAPFSIGGLQPYCREYFNGQPIWKVNGQKQRSHPNGYQRGVDQQTGALIWSHQVYPVEWETGPFWE